MHVTGTYSPAIRARLATLAVAAAVGAPFLATPSEAVAAKGCGGFHVKGLVTKVHVKVVRGKVSCRFARHVMKRRFNGRSTHGWKCIGPQTGYAACRKNGKRIKARF